jgi:hypothetical protein
LRLGDVSRATICVGMGHCNRFETRVGKGTASKRSVPDSVQPLFFRTRMHRHRQGLNPKPRRAKVRLNFRK